VFSWRDAETYNAITSYEKKRKASSSEKKNHKDLAVLATTPRLNRFF